MQLTTNFTLAEFCISETARKAGIANSPTAKHLVAIKRAAKGAQFIRDNLYTPPKPLVITSGYRNPAVNKLVGGVPTSDHCEGNAFDFYIKGADTKVMCKDLEAMLLRTGHKFHKMILELDRGIVHMSYDPELACLFMTQVGGAGGKIHAGIHPHLG